MYRSLQVHIDRFIKVGQALRGDLCIAKKDVPCIIKTPLEEAISLHNIKQGFRKCGVYPFDLNMIDKKLIMRGVPEDEVTNLSLSWPHSPPQHIDAGIQTDEALRMKNREAGGRKEEKKGRKRAKKETKNTGRQQETQSESPPQLAQQSSMQPSPEKLLHDDLEDDNFCSVCGKDLEEDDHQHELWLGGKQWPEVWPLVLR
ncbi:hypothetical protein HOLleu_41762 [Holothuria leucospilota]|uniref:Uncharacterized protein n=1 Tax=Holothuria leucospilota TaxID=206669 RepID=A0A9Q0YJL4_HOLLE|nr:hypothetical protein HOLleu_41762 [Holothuria leucospilota]